MLKKIIILFLLLTSVFAQNGEGETNNNNNNNNYKYHGSGYGSPVPPVIGGIVVGSVLGFALLCCIAYVIYQRYDCNCNSMRDIFPV